MSADGCGPPPPSYDASVQSDAAPKGKGLKKWGKNQGGAVVSQKEIVLDMYV